MRGALLASLVCFVPSSFAAIYENMPTAADEDDLREYQQQGVAEAATAATLLELAFEKIDLNSAGAEDLFNLPGLSLSDVHAILEHRRAVGLIHDPNELVTAGALTEEQLTQLSTFVADQNDSKSTVIRGRVRAMTRFALTDTIGPPMVVSARLYGPENLSAGFMVTTTRLRAGQPKVDPSGKSLVSDGFGYRPQLPRAFALWEPGNAKLLLGTFTIGFGERLTLDTTKRVTPNGIYLSDDFQPPSSLTKACHLSETCEPAELGAYLTPDFNWRENFRGLAGSIERISLGQEILFSVYGFVSYQQRSLYQYELYDRSVCTNPNDDRDPQCQAPSVYLADGKTRLVSSTLSNVFDELASGGHLALSFSNRLTLGVTGFAANPFFSQTPLQLDFQEHSRYPSGGAFGALGLNAQTHWNSVHFFIEATRTFDGRVGGPGGGFGLAQRSNWSSASHELELSFRFYDLGFGTPYSRPPSAPDAVDGFSARNEAGARLRWVTRPIKQLEACLRADFWVNPYSVINGTPAVSPNLYALARVEMRNGSPVRPAVWVDIRNRKLLSDGKNCTDSLDDDTTLCSGDRYQVGAQITFSPMGHWFRATLQAWFVWVDDPRYLHRLRNDLMAWAEIQFLPSSLFQFRLRSKYFNQDISDPTYLQTTFGNWVEVACLVGKGLRAAFRYDLFAWLDQRATTLNRNPNPEHRFQLDFQAVF